MEILDFKTKAIIFVIAFILLAIIGMRIDNQRDKTISSFDQYGNPHYSNVTPSITFFGSIVILWILSML